MRRLQERDPVRRTMPLGRVRDYVYLRMGMIDERQRRQTQRDVERAPRGRR